MMWKNKLTLMLIPDSKGISKQFSIRVSLIYAASALVLVLLLADFFLSAEFFEARLGDVYRLMVPPLIAVLLVGLAAYIIA